MNTTDMTTPAGDLWIEPDATVSDDRVRTGPRIGLNTAPEPWLSLPWRFWVAGNHFVSKGSGRRER
jgi:DNA-3-methyladenine glycosylase